MSSAPSSPRFGRAVLAGIGLALVLVCGSVASAAPAPAPTASAAPSAAPAAGDESPEYQRHLGAGIKLFEAGQLDPALREFEQAYTLSPQPAPLVNMALCYERLDSPEHPHPTAIPMAIAKLEQVLRAHGASLSAERRAPVEAKLRDLTPLVGELRIEVEPKEAHVAVGSVALEPAAVSQPLRVRSGTWEVRADLDGYTSAKASTTVTSGSSSTVKLRLQPATGELLVTPHGADTYVEIDKGQLAQGKWSGRLAPGTHQVRVFRPGEAVHTLQLVMVAGKSFTVTQSSSGELKTDAPLLGESAPAKPATGASAAPETPEAPTRTGFHILADSAILFGVHANEVPEQYQWTADRIPAGAALGLRGGYRPVDWLGFEVAAEYGVTWGAGTLHVKDDAQDAPTAKYTLHSLRLLGGLRAMVPAEDDIRFLAFAGTGAVYSSIGWNSEPQTLVAQGMADPNAVANHFGDASGTDFAVAVDLGVELDFNGILVDIMLQNVLQTGYALKPKNGVNEGPFDDRIMWFVGPAIRPGYEFF
jgi:hypothetical protein